MRQGVQLGGYQMMVRSEVLRGRYRNSYEKPEPFVANEPTTVKVPLQDVLHTFQKGHRIMVQVQSSWFPLVDRNPQKFVPNIFLADDKDFVKATQRVYRNQKNLSRIEVNVLPVQ
jgi:predicted acyl esterase